jgi:hypothetical protein
MASIKFIAIQAKSINQYMNLRTKIRKCCANIYFNLHLDPKDVGSFLTLLGLHKGLMMTLQG